MPVGRGGGGGSRQEGGESTQKVGAEGRKEVREFTQRRGEPLPPRRRTGARIAGFPSGRERHFHPALVPLHVTQGTDEGVSEGVYNQLFGRLPHVATQEAERERDDED